MRLSTGFCVPPGNNVMKKIGQSIILFVLSLSFMGCPYQSEVPITQPTFPVKKEYLGKWMSKDEIYNSYTVSKAGTSSYSIIQENTLGEQRQYTAHVSELKGGALFLNLHCDSSDIYYFYRIQIDAPTRLVLVPVAPSLSEYFISSASLRTFMEKNLSFQKFYDDENKARYELVEPAASAKKH